MHYEPSKASLEIINRFFKTHQMEPEETCDIIKYITNNTVKINTNEPFLQIFANDLKKLNWNSESVEVFGIIYQNAENKNLRRNIGIHYTNTSNILKVLDPLFLDDVRDEMEKAGGNSGKLETLLTRIGEIRVFDPACGAGNFLIVAYKELRTIEAEINRRLRVQGRVTRLNLSNFRGIEINRVPAEIAHLSLSIVKYQCDVLYCGRSRVL